MPGAGQKTLGNNMGDSGDELAGADIDHRIAERHAYGETRRS